PLRDRPEDILPIADRVLTDIARRAGLKRLALAPEAAEALLAHGWPGNVRELEHVLRAASLFAEGARLTLQALAASGFAAPPGPAVPPGSHAALQADIAARERAFVERLLAGCDGNRARATAAASISRFA